MDVTEAIHSFLESFVFSLGAILLYNKICSKDKVNEPKTKVLFFTKYDANCRKPCYNKQIPCSSRCSMLKVQELINVIESAKISLDVCIYLITCQSLSRAIIRAHRRGVKVRIIYDEDMSFSTESKTSNFLQEDIHIKTNANQRNINMHHKYCVLDSKTENRRLITGSLNWTMQGVAGNYEYVVITSCEELVEQYQNIFNNLWNKFETKKKTVLVKE